jgi:hypothetical protein
MNRSIDLWQTFSLIIEHTFEISSRCLTREVKNLPEVDAIRAKVCQSQIIRNLEQIAEAASRFPARG